MSRWCWGELERPWCIPEKFSLRGKLTILPPSIPFSTQTVERTNWNHAMFMGFILLSTKLTNLLLYLFSYPHTVFILALRAMEYHLNHPDPLKVKPPRPPKTASLSHRKFYAVFRHGGYPFLEIVSLRTLVSKYKPRWNKNQQFSALWQKEWK